MLPVFLVNEHGMTGQQAGFVYAGVSIGGIIGPLLGGWLSDRWNRIGTAVLYTGVCFVSMLLIIYLPTGLALYAVLFVFMIVVMGYFLITWAIIVDRVPPEQRPPINGLFIAVSVALSTIAPFIIGLLGDAFSLRVGFMYPAAAALGGFFVLLYLLWRRSFMRLKSNST
jgi:MFS family permease